MNDVSRLITYRKRQDLAFQVLGALHADRHRHVAALLVKLTVGAFRF
jgi:hypothetical protein